MTGQSRHDAWASGESYDLYMGRWSRQIAPRFLGWLDPAADLDWLDVGCGTGAFTELVLDRCAPASVLAVDPVSAQIGHAQRLPVGRRADFQVADARALPFADSTFDIVTAALVLNFITDRPRALSEVRRASRAGGVIAAYVWDFGAELSPSWPFRAGMRRFGCDVPDVPGTKESSIDALLSLFERAGLERIATKTIDVTLPFADFADFWEAQTPSYSPTTKMIAKMASSDRMRLIDTVRAGLPVNPDGSIEYSARANAIKARVPD